MAHVSEQQEYLTGAGPDLCRDAVIRFLEGIHAKPQASGSTVTGQVGSYGMYDFHGRKHPQELPVSITVAIEDQGPARRVTMVAESQWPFESLDDWMAADYRTRCREIVATIQEAIAEATTPVAVG
jgi:hypothetical protein